MSLWIEIDRETCETVKLQISSSLVCDHSDIINVPPNTPYRYPTTKTKKNQLQNLSLHKSIPACRGGWSARPRARGPVVETKRKPKPHALASLHSESLSVLESSPVVFSVRHVENKNKNRNNKNNNNNKPKQERRRMRMRIDRGGCGYFDQNVRMCVSKTQLLHPATNNSKFSNFLGSGRM